MFKSTVRKKDVYIRILRNAIVILFLFYQILLLLERQYYMSCMFLSIFIFWFSANFISLLYRALNLVSEIEVVDEVMIMTPLFGQVRKSLISEVDIKVGPINECFNYAFKYDESLFSNNGVTGHIDIDDEIFYISNRGGEAEHLKSIDKVKVIGDRNSNFPLIIKSIKYLSIIIFLLLMVFLSFYAEKVGLEATRISEPREYSINCMRFVCRFSTNFNDKQVSGYAENCSSHYSKEATLYHGTAFFSKKQRYYLICKDQR